MNQTLLRYENVKVITSYVKPKKLAYEHNRNFSIVSFF